MLVTALSPVIGYDKASKIGHYAMDNDLTLKGCRAEAAFQSGSRVRPNFIRERAIDGPDFGRGHFQDIFSPGWSR